VAFCLNLTYAQWDFTLNQSEKILSAIGVFKFNLSEYDTISLNLSKSRKLGIDLAIEGDFFNTSEHYFVLFEIDNRKIKMISSLKEKGKLRLLKLKDIKSKQEFEIIDFLKVIKGGSECILTISSGFKVIQGFNKLIGSEDSINRVLIGNYPY
jgi:hypothetical protein